MDSKTISDCKYLNQNVKMCIIVALDYQIKRIKENIKEFEDEVNEKGTDHSDDYIYIMHITKTKVLPEYIKTREHVKNTPNAKVQGTSHN